MTNTILNFNSIESELRTALSNSAKDFENNIGDADSWAVMNLRNNIETQMQSWTSQFNNNNNCCGGSETPPGNGFRISFGLQILVSYKVSLRANLNLGFGERSGNFTGTGSLHFAAYNGGLGTSFGKKNMVVDITAAANVIVGTGNAMPLQSYSLNYNSPIPTLNDFNKSFSYGQLLTWNSALNENEFSLSKLQREGMIGFRIGDVNVSSNNDTFRFYKGGGTDMGWTGGLSIVTPFAEVGFQDFSGDYLKNGVEQEQKREEILGKIKKIKNSNLGELSKKFELEKLDKELIDLTKGKFHQQEAYQKTLNQASTYFRINQNGFNATIDVIGDAWLQNAIHKSIKDFKFEYEHKKVELWGGFGR